MKERKVGSDRALEVERDLSELTCSSGQSSSNSSSSCSECLEVSVVFVVEFLEKVGDVDHELSRRGRTKRSGSNSVMYQIAAREIELLC